MGEIRVVFDFIAARVIGATAAIIVLYTSSAMAQSPGWMFSHFNGTNESAAHAMTAPAGAGSKTVPNIGTFANGAGPVTAHDGTVYLGNEQGRLMAFTPDGAPIWNVGLSGGEAIVASPMVWWDQGIYVVGVTETTAALYRFAADGRELSRSPFPQHHQGGIMTSAPHPASGPGRTFIVLPVAYKVANAPAYETRLLFYSLAGGLAIDERIDTIVASTTGSFGSATLAPGPEQLELPYPTAVNWSNSSTGRHYVAVADGFETLVSYEVTNNGLVQMARWDRNDEMRTFVVTPSMHPSGALYAFNTRGFLNAYIDGTNESELSDYRGHTPRTVVPFGGLTIYHDDLVISDPYGKRKIQLPGRSIAPPAASRNYIYISSEYAFTTYVNHRSMQQVSRVDWVGGGRNPPIIGPKGHVYAIASNILFIFPPSKKPGPLDGTSVLTPGNPPLGTPPGGKPLPGVGEQEPLDGDQNSQSTAPQSPNTQTFDTQTFNGQPLQVQPMATQPAAALPPSQLYHPPLTTGGNRLFACQELDQDDCGKGDHTDISLAWCQKQGYAKVKGYDVDSRKVKAETLDGRFCAKNKCKVFDSIACEM